MDNGQIIIFQTQGGKTRIEVRLSNETVWLTADQMAELFQRSKSAISRNITYDSGTNLGCNFRNQQIVVVQNSDVIENDTDVNPDGTNKGSIVTNDATNGAKRNNSGTITEQ